MNMINGKTTVPGESCRFTRHILWGGVTGITTGAIVGTILSLIVIDLNEPLARSFIDSCLVVVYLLALYVIVLGFLGLGLGLATGLAAKFFSRDLAPETEQALYSACLVGLALLIYTARRFTHGLYFSDHPNIDTYGEMVAFYLLLVTFYSILAIGVGTLVFFAIRGLLRWLSRHTKWSNVPGRLIAVATGVVCCLVVGSVLVHNQVLDSQSLAPVDTAYLRKPESQIGSKRHKVILLGLDGATWDVLQMQVELGHVPTLEKLITNGVTANLATLPSAASPIIWTSIATGMTPAKHGILGFTTTKVPKCAKYHSTASRIRGSERISTTFLAKIGYREGCNQFRAPSEGAMDNS